MDHSGSHGGIFRHNLVDKAEVPVGRDARRREDCITRILGHGRRRKNGEEFGVLEQGGAREALELEERVCECVDGSKKETDSSSPFLFISASPVLVSLFHAPTVVSSFPASAVASSILAPVHRVALLNPHLRSVRLSVTRSSWDVHHSWVQLAGPVGCS